MSELPAVYTVDLDAPDPTSPWEDVPDADLIRVYGWTEASIAQAHRSAYVHQAGVPSATELAASDSPYGPFGPRVPAQGATYGAEPGVDAAMRRMARFWTWVAYSRGDFDGPGVPARLAEDFYGRAVSYLRRQVLSPNSPAWYSAGLWHAYGIERHGPTHWQIAHPRGTGPDVPVLTEADGTGRPLHACYIQTLRDDLAGAGGIFDLGVREAAVYRSGGGSGADYSAIRGRGEPLSGGGTSSGLMSFLAVHDRGAGAIKSGGTTRRAAKMVVLDIDHPDVEDFVDAKPAAEEIAESLALGSAALAALGEATYLRPLTLAWNADGSNAYGLAPYQNANHSIRADGARLWALYDADGDLELKPRTGGPGRKVRARALVDRIARATWRSGDPGVQWDDLIQAAHTCPSLGRIRASNPCVTGGTLVATAEGWRPIGDLVGGAADIIGADGRPHPVDQIFPTGRRPVYDLTTRAGYRVRLTADHLVATQRGDVAAADLRPDDQILLGGAGFGAVAEPLAEAIGLALGDGCAIARDRGRSIVLTMHADEEPILARVAGEARAVRGAGPGRPTQSTYQTPTGSRLTLGAAAVVERFERYAVLDAGSAGKALRPAVHDLDRASTAALLRGLFTADGTVANYGDKSQYVGLDSTSEPLLRAVQILLLSFGIKAKLYAGRRAGRTSAVMPDGRGGARAYPVAPMFSLRISRSGRIRFEAEIGFAPESAKAARLRELNAARGVYAEPLTDAFASLEAAGEADVYDLTERATDHFVAGGLVVHNCSEYLFVDDTACNLAAVRVSAFAGLPWDRLLRSVRRAASFAAWILDLTIDAAAYPVRRIAEQTAATRTIGAGLMDLGALLMLRGVRYSSQAGQALGAAVMAEISNGAAESSIDLAERYGPFPAYAANAAAVLAAFGAQVADPALRERAAVHGYRNAQLTVIAPTGTTGLVAGCDATGAEPLHSAAGWTKHFADGRIHRYRPRCVDAAIAAGHGDSVEDVGSLTPSDHLLMVAALQPHVSGAISKTVNLPASATVGDVRQILRRSWELGIKAVSIYRDGSKRSQPLGGSDPDALTATRLAALRRPPAPADDLGELAATRTKARIAGRATYLTIARAPDGAPLQLRVEAGPAGTPEAALYEGISRIASLALRAGVPLAEIAETLEACASPSEAGPVVRPVRGVRWAQGPLNLWGRYLLAAADAEAPANAPAPPAGAGAPSAGPSRERCPKCGEPALERAGTCQTCRACGASTGGCG